MFYQAKHYDKHQLNKCGIVHFQKTKLLTKNEILVMSFIQDAVFPTKQQHISKMRFIVLSPILQFQYNSEFTNSNSFAGLP